MVNEWNRKMAEITGFSREEVLGRSLVKEFITATSTGTPSRRCFQNALQGTETANFELPLFTKKAERVEVLLNAATRRNTAGAVDGVVGVGQDITERKSAETRVSNVANDLRLLIDNANAPIIGIDAFGLRQRVEQQGGRDHGVHARRGDGRYLVRDFIIDEYKVAVNAVLNKALQGKETDNFEFPFITKGGERVEVLLNATTRRDTTGKILGVVGVGQDITELKRGKAELQRVANDLTLLIDTANAPIFGIDADGLVNEWNRKMAAITGFSKEEVMGKRPRRRVHQRRVPPVGEGGARERAARRADGQLPAAAVHEGRQARRAAAQRRDALSTLRARSSVWWAWARTSPRSTSRRRSCRAWPTT